MPNFSITGDFKDGISPGLRRVGHEAREAGGSVRELGRSFAETGEAAEANAEQLGKSAAETGKSAAATEQSLAAGQQLARHLRDLAPVARAAQENLRGLGQAAQRALGESQRAFGESEAALDRFGRTSGQLLQGIGEKFDDTFMRRVPFAVQAGRKAFEDLERALDEGLANVFAASFSKSTLNAKKTWEKFVESLESSFYQSLGRMASALVQENLLAPAFKLAQDAAGTLLSAGKSLLGLSRGGLVTKPTVALVGEAGPELVIPLKAAGEFVKDALVEAAGREAVKDVVLEAGMAEGLEAAASAGAAAAAVTGAALFAFADALNHGAGTRAIGDLLFGQRGGPGVVNQALGAIGLSAFGRKSVSPEEHGRANVEAIRQLVRDFPGFFEAEDLIARTGGNPFTARELMGAAGAFRAFAVGGDAVGRFITGPSLRLLGERGPEHVLNVDSEPSVRALREGLRPLLRELFEEERRASGSAARPVAVSVDARGALFPDERGMEKLARMIEERLRAFQSRRVG